MAGRSRRPARGFTLVRSGVLREVSIVALGADAGTSVSIAAHTGEGGTHDRHGSDTLTAEQIRAEAAGGNGTHHGDPPRLRRAVRRHRGPAIREGWDPAADGTGSAAGRRGRGTLHPYAAVAPTRHVIEAAILAHMGHETLAEKHLGPHAAQQARDLRATSLVDLCRAALATRWHGCAVRREALIRASLSTYSLPSRWAMRPTKCCLDAYTESPATWRAFAAIKSANDFKDHTGVRPSQTGRPGRGRCPAAR